MIAKIQAVIEIWLQKKQRLPAAASAKSGRPHNIKVMNMKVTVKSECQECRSTNYYLHGDALVCHDCGKKQSILSSNMEIEEMRQCIFCGGDEFYKDHTLGLSFLPYKCRCYICEAMYPASMIQRKSKGFSRNKFIKMFETDCAIRWARYWNVDLHDLISWQINGRNS
jgi:hypothetical protein